MSSIKIIAVGITIGVACIFITFEIYNRYWGISSTLDHYVQAMSEQGLFNGTVLVAKDNKIVLCKAYGMANVELGVPNKVSTKFNIAAITKSFTASAIMLLQEMGKLEVHDVLSKYIPDFPNGNKITIHHLLTHTSGITSWSSDYRAERMQHYTLEGRMALFADEPLESSPGKKFYYSDNNYILLAYIVEKTSGTTYENFFQDHIFDPLAMKNTGFDDYKRIIKHKSSGYGAMDKKLVHGDYSDPSYDAGSGNMYSTVEDIYRWDQALYTNKLMSQKSVEKMFTPYHGLYGYGWTIEQSDNGKIIYNRSVKPGASVIIWRHLEHKACIIVLSNFEHANIAIMVKGLKQIIFQ